MIGERSDDGRISLDELERLPTHDVMTRLCARDVDAVRGEGVEKTNAVAELNPDGVATDPVVPWRPQETFRDNLQPSIPRVQGIDMTSTEDPPREAAKVIPIGRGLADIPWGSRPMIGDVARSLLMHEDWMGVLAIDDYRGGAVVKRKAPPWEGAAIGSWTSSDNANARAWFGERYHAIVSRDVLDDAVTITAHKTRANSLVDELRSFSWDGEPRLDRWIVDLCGADDDPLVRAQSRKFLISAVARAHKPGCTVQHVLVLEGPSGVAKTRALRAIAGDAHYCDAPLDMASMMNAPILLSGVWFYIFDELAVLDRPSVEQVNQFVTLDRDEYTLKHKSEKTRVPRSCVLAGTTTRHEWLASPDGARRWWPIRVRGLGRRRKIDVDAIARDREQIFAEAVVAYDTGEQWHLEDDLESEAEERRSTRVSIDELEEPITAYLAKNAHRFLDHDAFLTVSELLTKALKLQPGEWNRHKKRVATVLTDRLGWCRGQNKIPTAQGRFVPYYPPPNAPELPEPAPDTDDTPTTE